MRAYRVCILVDGGKVTESIDACELRKNTIARPIRDSPPRAIPSEPVEDCAPFGRPFESDQLHEAAVALNICCEDCDEAMVS